MAGESKYCFSSREMEPRIVYPLLYVATFIQLLMSTTFMLSIRVNLEFYLYLLCSLELIAGV